MERIDAGRFVRLSGDTKAETTAILRAGKLLEESGDVVLVRLWVDDDRRVGTVAFPPGYTVKGRPVAELSVDRVTGVTWSTFKGSIRHIAKEQNVSSTTIWRDLKLAGKKQK
jgi:hypothetical protein